LSGESILSAADVQKLLSDPSADNRAELAEKISAQFDAGGLSDQERTIAEEIFRAMVHDAEVRVRRALAESLKNCSDLPHDVAIVMAEDVEEVSLPVIEFSSVLTERDLVYIIENSGSAARSAVAKRENVPEAIADVLLETDDENVIESLVSNEGAELSEGTMNLVIDRFGENERINAPLAQRAYVPVKVAEKLVALVSENIREHLVTHHEMTDDMATDLVIASRERATVSLLEDGSGNLEVLALVDQLYNHNRLTPTIILRAMCMGDLTFFEAALAKRAGISVANVYKLVHDKGEGTLAKLFAKAKMPETTLPMSREAVLLWEETRHSAGDDRDAFKTLMIERLLTRFEDEFDGAHLDYFISKIGASH
jgi:uncharacterized protein (DUF2336 family)